MLDRTMQFLRRFRWPVLVAAAAIVLFLLARARPVQVDTAAVERGRIEQLVTEEAETQLDVVRVLTADRAGTMRRCELEVGDRVEKGQVLTSIEDRELELTVGRLRDQLDEIEGRLEGVDTPLPEKSELLAAEEAHRQAQIEAETLAREKKAAEADLRFAQREWQRIQDLYDQGTASVQQRDEARHGLEVAEARLEAVTSRLRAARTGAEVARLRKQVLDESMDDTAHLRRVYGAQKKRIRKELELLEHESQVVSPLDGVILEKYVDSDRFVQPGTALLEIGDLDSIEIRSDVLSDEVPQVKVGQKAYLVGKAVRNPGAAGTVKQVYPSGFEKISSLGVRQQRVAVLIDFDNSELRLGPGYELDVKIVVGAVDDAVTAPRDAVFSTADGMGCFVLQGGAARLRPVKIGLTGEHRYQITEGLKPGETVIVRPPTDLEKGDRVKPKAGSGE
ncbi:MAG: efflux RND transporter periplasmic adaptor subunit [Planctomycetota bacterium]